MRERLRPILDNLASFVAPGLVLLLLGIQVAFGLRGFDRPDDSLLYVLQVPGVLLGWGGVALLLPLLVWMVLDWWGYDLGGFALKGLGSAVLGVAAGTLCGLLGDVPSGNVASGGIVGGSLAGVLAETVGGVVSVVLLLLMAAPAAILAFSMQKRAARPRARVAAASGAPGARPRYGVLAHFAGLFVGRRRAPRDPARETWYPERRFDEHGNELPMDFGRERDVGDIRFAEPEREADEEPEAAAARPPVVEVEGEERLPTIPELLAGNFAGERRTFRDDPSGGPRESDGDVPDDGPVHVGSDGRPLEAPARTTLWEDAVADAVAAATPVAAPEPEDEEDVRHVAGTSQVQRVMSFAPAAQAVEAEEEALPPGVRYADEVVAAPAPSDVDDEADAPAEDAATPVLSASVRNAVRGPGTTPQEVAHTARSIRETLRARVEAIQAEGASSRYLAKLDALGLFDPAEDPPAAATAGPKAGAGKKAARKKAAKRAAPAKKATRKAAPKKKVAKKKAVKKKAAKKKTAKKKAAKKKAARSQTARTKQAARKKASGRKAAKPKAGRKQAAAKAPAARRASPALERRRRAAMLEALRIERLDPLFARAVTAALERGAASPVLLTRRLGLPLARARSLLERLIAAGVLEEASPRGSHAVAITKQEWAAAQG